MKWDRFQTVYDHYRRGALGNTLALGLSPAKIYDRVLRDLGSRSETAKRRGRMQQIGTTLEKSWYALSMPTYKVWPDMIHALMKTKIQIPGTQLELPFPVFEIRVPPNLVRESPDAMPLRGLLVGTYVETCADASVPDRRKLVVSVCFDDGDLTPTSNTIVTNFPLTERTIAGDLAIALKNGERLTDKVDEEGGYWPGFEHTHELTALACGVAFIAVSKDRKLISPDAAKKNRKKSRRRKHETPEGMGWRVGADVKLPRATSRSRSTGDEAARGPLNYGHVRSGHMRWQPCGPGRLSHKLIFVPPTVVRQDLPLKPRSTPNVIPGAKPDRA